MEAFLLTYYMYANASQGLALSSGVVNESFHERKDITDIPAYSDTGYSGTPVTVIVLTVPN